MPLLQSYFLNESLAQQSSSQVLLLGAQPQTTNLHKGGFWQVLGLCSQVGRGNEKKQREYTYVY